jgi:hypothetical protein
MGPIYTYVVLRTRRQYSTKYIRSGSLVMGPMVYVGVYLSDVEVRGTRGTYISKVALVYSEMSPWGFQDP